MDNSTPNSPRRHWSKDPEMCARVKAKLTGIKRSDETKAKLKARVITPEWRKKLSEAASKRVYTDALREKRRQQLKSQPGRNLGRKFGPETRAKQSAAGKGRVFTDKHRAALSKASKGHAPALFFHKGRSVDYIDRFGTLCHLMSSYEHAVAKWLDETNEDWLYVGRDKSHSLLLADGRRYYPDFYLRRINLYIDPKGFDRNPEKRIAVESQHPGRVAFLIGKTYLEQLKELLCRQPC